MKPKTVEIELATDDDDGICQSQTPLAGGALTIDGGLATDGVAAFDAARRILLTFAGDESARTFTITGTNRHDFGISEEVAGTDSTAVTAQDFKTVTSVEIDDASAGAIKVGTGTSGSTDWIPLSANLNPFSVGFGCTVEGTVNYTVEHTYGSVQSYTARPDVFQHETVASKAENLSGSYSAPVSAVRLTVNSGTGTARMTVVQAG